MLHDKNNDRNGKEKSNDLYIIHLGGHRRSGQVP